MWARKNHQKWIFNLLCFPKMTPESFPSDALNVAICCTVMMENCILHTIYSHPDNMITVRKGRIFQHNDSINCAMKDCNGIGRRWKPIRGWEKEDKSNQIFLVISYEVWSYCSCITFIIKNFFKVCYHREIKYIQWYVHFLLFCSFYNICPSGNKINYIFIIYTLKAIL